MGKMSCFNSGQKSTCETYLLSAGTWEGNKGRGGGRDEEERVSREWREGLWIFIEKVKANGDV